MWCVVSYGSIRGVVWTLCGQNGRLQHWHLFGSLFDKLCLRRWGDRAIRLAIYILYIRSSPLFGCAIWGAPMLVDSEGHVQDGTGALEAWHNKCLHGLLGISDFREWGRLDFMWPVPSMSNNCQTLLEIHQLACSYHRYITPLCNIPRHMGTGTGERSSPSTHILHYGPATWSLLGCTGHLSVSLLADADCPAPLWLPECRMYSGKGVVTRLGLLEPE